MRYVIREINSEGYERFVLIEGEGHKKINVHFLEYDEFLEEDEKTRKRKIGDVIEGEISIQLITASQRVNEELSYQQKIKSSPHIEAVVEVVKVMNGFSLYALSAMQEKSILIEFETPTDYKVGERIWISGELELKL